MTVTLAWYEVYLGAMVGVLRMVAAIRDGKQHAYGSDPDDAWRCHIEGALGERAVAKATGRYYAGPIDTYRNGGDVGRWQVKTRRPGYELLVRDADRDDDVFVLVVGRVPVYDVVGWTTGGAAKRPEYLKGHGGRPPAYFVPPADLRPLVELID